MAKVFVNYIHTSSSPMLFRRIFTSLARSDLQLSLIPKHIISGSFAVSSQFDQTQFRFKPQKEVKFTCQNLISSSSDSRRMNEAEARRPPVVPLPPITGEKVELLRGLESALGSPFSSDPLSPKPNPLIIVISGPSGVGKDAVIKRLREVREGIHFVVTATSREKRPGEIEGKDYYFVNKEQFLSMIQRDELLEYALVYGDYKGIPKQQIRDFMSNGYDIVLRVDIQGAATLRSILGNSAIFIFLVAESESALVKRLVDRKTETTDKLLVRIATAREEVKHLRDFDYVVVNAQGKLENAVKLVESIIDAEKARVIQRRPII